MASPSRFSHLKPKSPPDIYRAAQDFIQGATDRVEGSDIQQRKVGRPKRDKKRIIFSLPSECDQLITKLSQLPSDFRPDRSDVVAAALYAFDEMSEDDKIDRLRSIRNI